MKNEKGFAISSMIYTVLLLFLVLLLGILGILGTRKVILDKMKREISMNISGTDKIHLRFLYENPQVTNTSSITGFTFHPTDIVEVVDGSGNKITGASVSYDSKPTFDSTKNGSYEITYTGTYQEKAISQTITVEVVTPTTYDYGYTGREQTFETPSKGKYRIELWGAQGGSSLLDGGTRALSKDNCSAKGYCYGGKGSYTSGNIDLEQYTQLYLHVGEKGKTGIQGAKVEGGYNGGGTGDYDLNDDEADGAGGGATDVRLVSGNWDNITGLRSRIMVAGAGGGAHDVNEAAVGGGLSSPQTATSASATQTTGYQFGKGQDGVTVRKNYPLAGAGGGYYGGYATDGTGWDSISSGGSSYISGHLGSVAVTSATSTTPKTGCQNGTTDIGCSYHYSGLYFTDTTMKAGNEQMPTYNHLSTMVGNSDDGYALITPLIVEKLTKASNLITNSGFEDGVLEQWLYSNTQYDLVFDDSTSVTGKYSIKLTTKKTHTDNQQAYQIFNAIPGHIYYGTSYIKAVVNDTAKTLTRITFSPGTTWDWLMYSTSTSTSKNQWMKHSIYYTNPSYTTLKFRVTIGGNSAGTTIGDYYNIDNAMVLDLTEIYGAGNEPSKEWCDQNIRYFNGAGYVPIYQK